MFVLVRSTYLSSDSPLPSAFDPAATAVAGTSFVVDCGRTHKGGAHLSLLYDTFLLKTQLACGRTSIYACYCRNKSRSGFPLSFAIAALSQSSYGLPSP